MVLVTLPIRNRARSAGAAALKPRNNTHPVDGWAVFFRRAGHAAFRAAPTLTRAAFPCSSAPRDEAVYNWQRDFGAWLEGAPPAAPEFKRPKSRSPRR